MKKELRGAAIALATVAVAAFGFGSVTYHEVPALTVLSNIGDLAFRARYVGNDLVAISADSTRRMIVQKRLPPPPIRPAYSLRISDGLSLNETYQLATNSDSILVLDVPESRWLSVKPQLEGDETAEAVLSLYFAKAGEYMTEIRRDYSGVQNPEKRYRMRFGNVEDVDPSDYARSLVYDAEFMAGVGDRIFVGPGCWAAEFEAYDPAIRYYLPASGLVLFKGDGCDHPIGDPPAGPRLGRFSFPNTWTFRFTFADSFNVDPTTVGPGSVRLYRGDVDVTPSADPAFRWDHYFDWAVSKVAGDYRLVLLDGAASDTAGTFNSAPDTISRTIE